MYVRHNSSSDQSVTLRPEQITARAEAGPIAGRFALRPRQPSLALVDSFHADIEQPRGSRVLTEHAADFAFHFRRVTALPFATGLHASQAGFDFLFKPPHDRVFFLKAILAAAENENSGRSSPSFLSRRFLILIAGQSQSLTSKPSRT